MAGWHHWLNGRESEWTPGVGDGQGGLAHCYSWGHRVRLDWATELNWTDTGVGYHFPPPGDLPDPAAEPAFLVSPVSACVLSQFQSCPTLCDPMDYSLPGSSVHEILQARILEWVAMASFRGSSQPRDRTCVSYVSFKGGQALYHQRHLGSPCNGRQITSSDQSFPEVFLDF